MLGLFIDQAGYPTFLTPAGLKELGNPTFRGLNGGRARSSSGDSPGLARIWDRKSTEDTELSPRELPGFRGHGRNSQGIQCDTAYGLPVNPVHLLD